MTNRKMVDFYAACDYFEFIVTIVTGKCGNRWSPITIQLGTYIMCHKWMHCIYLSVKKLSYFLN